MTYETILAETNGAVTTITLNRPKALNALSSVVLDDLIAAFAAYQSDDSQRCAILTGSGDKAFAAGADIKEMQAKAGCRFLSRRFLRALDQRYRQHHAQTVDRGGQRLCTWAAGASWR